MPVLSKQKPPPVVANVLPPDDILSEAISVADLIDDFIKICIYGPNRVGKTTLGAQFPKPALLISFEPGASGGAASIKQIPGITYFHIVPRGWRDHRGNVQDEWGKDKALRLAARLKRENPYKTIILDTVTSLQDLILQQILDLPEIPEQLNWGMIAKEQYQARSEVTKETLRPFLNLPCHIVALAQQKDHNAQREMGNKLLRGIHAESSFAADLGGATVKWLHDACDYIGQLYLDKETKIQERLQPGFNGAKPVKVREEIETGRVIRRLRTMLHPNFAAGFRSANPEAVPEFINSPTFAKIEKVIRGEMLPPADAKYQTN